MCRAMAIPAAALIFVVYCFHVSKGTISPVEWFSEDILNIYGENGSLTLSQLNDLLRKIGVGQEQRDRKANVTTGGKLHFAQCLLTEDIISLYDLNNSVLTRDDVKEICPAILHQLTIQPCRQEQHLIAEEEINIHEVWGFGVLAVTIISLMSLLGLTVVPLLKKPYFSKILIYFIGLAIGTLFSNAVFQLIPEAFGFDPRNDGYILKSVAIFGGFYLLFFTERILKISLKADGKHGHSHTGSIQTSKQTPTKELELLNSWNANTDLNHFEHDSHYNHVDNKEVERTILQNSDSSYLNNKSTEKTGCNTDDKEKPTRNHKHKLSGVATVAWMITLGDALHNFIDGLAIGASFTVSSLQGLSTSIAILCEELPHELGDFVILINSGMSTRQALFFNFMSACSCYIGLAFGVLVGTKFSPNYIFGVAGGMFLYISLSSMFLEMNETIMDSIKTRKSDARFFLIQNAGIITGFIVILLLTIFAGDIQLD
ncbi:metal cation symporter ZIP8 [Protopterus annectens]|uniref:metal cation symporter ZIP8 n=1 Tax=Protopterus annectens TaxID=7888 RepID=UPI001CFA58F8|nr:metal cation symporter ZIP8 [Protopterus annectens]